MLVAMMGQMELLPGRRKQTLREPLRQPWNRGAWYGCVWLLQEYTHSNVVPLNNILKKLASFNKIKCIDLYSEVTKQGFISKKYNACDGIHFSKAGNCLLVHSIDQCVPIVKAQNRHIVAQNVIENRYTGPNVCTFPESQYSQEWSTSSNYPAIRRNTLNTNKRRNCDDRTLYFKQHQYNNRATSHQQRNNHNQQSDNDREALYYYNYIIMHFIYILYYIIIITRYFTFFKMYYYYMYHY